MKSKLFAHSFASGMTYGAVLGVFLFIINTPSDATFTEVLKLLFVALICAVISGVFLSLLILLVEHLRSKRFDGFRAELRESGRELRVEDKASRLLDGKQVHGRLFLTEETLLFRPSSKDVGCLEIALKEISSVEITDPRRCQVTVSLSSLEAETFTVTDPVAWFHLLGDAEN